MSRKLVHTSDHVIDYIDGILVSLRELRTVNDALDNQEQIKKVLTQRQALVHLNKIFNGKAFFIGVPGRKKKR